MGELFSKCFIEPRNLPPGGEGFFQVLFLGLAYGYILYSASNMIAEGSELLLLVPSMAAIVGPVVLPILGAVPDGAIVLFSGLGPNAQYELQVGVGALAGSTIMLLTVPWFLSVMGGRVDIVEGQLQYRKPPLALPGWKKLTPGNWGLRSSGVECSPYVSFNGLILVLTAASYLVIQIPAFYASQNALDIPQQAKFEKVFAGVGMILCVVLFCGYLAYQYRQAQRGEDEPLEAQKGHVRLRAIRDMKLSLRAVLAELLNLHKSSGVLDSVRVLHGDAENAILSTNGLPLIRSVSSLSQVSGHIRDAIKDVLRPFFSDMDLNRDGKLDFAETRYLLRELNEFPPDGIVEAIFRQFDRDHSGFIDFSEFVDLIVSYLLTPENECEILTGSGSPSEKDMEKTEETEEVPEDLAHLSYEQQQWYLKRRAFTNMALGTLLILIFSDPMVGVFSEVGSRTGVPPFYISFVLAPLASNASELLASFNYSKKKTRKTIGVAFSALQGAGCMNNTFCLAVFLGLIFFRDLVWSFSAETLAILFVELCMGLVAQQKVLTVLGGLFVLFLYPLSIAIVSVLENMYHMN